MTIKQQLTKKEFQRASTTAMFGKLSIQIIYGILVLLSLVSIVIKISNPDLDIPFAPIILIIVVPLFAYITSGRRYDLNNDIQNLVTFEFENEILTISGSGITAQLPIESLYKVYEKKNWFFVQQTRQIYYPISKNGLNNNQEDYLRNLCQQGT